MEVDPSDSELAKQSPQRRSLRSREDLERTARRRCVSLVNLRKNILAPARPKIKKPAMKQAFPDYYPEVINTKKYLKTKAQPRVDADKVRFEITRATTEGVDLVFESGLAMQLQ